MTASDLTNKLKPLMSIRATLNRADITETYFYTATHRRRELNPKARGALAAALRETARKLRSIADELNVSA